MAFVSSFTPRRTPRRTLCAPRRSLCAPRATTTPPPPQTPPPAGDSNNDGGKPTFSARKLSVQNTQPSAKKLVRNKPSSAPDAGSGPGSVYADARPGDMVGGPAVGEGLGPRRGVGEKKVTKAAAIQKSQSFADAWSEQNAGRVDVWLIIGAVTLLTPIVILLWAGATGVIPLGGLFDE